MDNYYHHVAKMPALKARKMPKGLEELAQNLVESGRFRVDTIRAQNFVRWNRPYEGINVMFSKRELYDVNLLPRTKKTIRKILRRKYSGSKLKLKVAAEVKRMQKEVEKNIEVSHHIEIALARLIVQAAEPQVIMLAIVEGAEIFVSYSYSVGDMLDIQTWREAGDSSGLQSTQRGGCAVYVSTGGDPLIPKKKVERPTDGFHALSRLMVIAGQELAHYADIIREGPNAGARFSAEWQYGRASKIARIGRKKDMKTVFNMHNKMLNIGLNFIAKAESDLKFYKEHRKWSFVVLRSKLKVLSLQAIFITFCRIKGYSFLKSFYKDEYMCSKISLMLKDMLFNLEPQADAYKRPDPIEEEMIMCIEALARVQQQANKWGRDVTKAMYPNLYDLYYNNVIPSCQRAVEQITQEEFPKIF